MIQKENHYKSFNGTFIDGFENNEVPFDKYKIIRNCNCIITVNLNGIHISNKHNTIFLLDEPELYLHETLQNELCKKLVEISKEEGIVIYCTHF